MFFSRCLLRAIDSKPRRRSRWVDNPKCLGGTNLVWWAWIYPDIMFLGMLEADIMSHEFVYLIKDCYSSYELAVLYEEERRNGTSFAV